MSTTRERTSERTDDEQTCPVPGCDYTHSSPQGIIAHVGHHPNGWEEAERSPPDIQQEATANDEWASERVARVEHYLRRCGVNMDAVRVYYHFGYKAVQIRLEDELTDAEWETYTDATHVEGIDYRGDDRSQCASAFVDDLPPVKVGDRCEADGCDETDELSASFVGESGPFTYCRYHRKHYLGVSS